MKNGCTDLVQFLLLDISTSSLTLPIFILTLISVVLVIKLGLAYWGKIYVTTAVTLIL